MLGQKVKVYHPTKKDANGQKRIVEINARTLQKAIRDMGYTPVDMPEKPPVNTKQAALDTIKRIQQEEESAKDIPSEKPKPAKK